MSNVALCLPVSVASPQNMYAPGDSSSVYGHRGIRLSPILAAFVNGVAVSMNKWNRCVSMHQTISRAQKPVPLLKSCLCVSSVFGPILDGKQKQDLVENPKNFHHYIRTSANIAF